MARKTNIRSLMQFLVLIFSIPFFCLFYGCGTAEEGTTIIGTGGLQVSLTGSPTSLAVGQNSILTATVTDSSGKVVSGQTVVFSFISNPSGATVATLNGGTTDGSGRAVAVYTAGATTPASSVQDTIRASVTGSTSAVIITRTASTVIPPVGYRMALAADVTSLAAGQNSILTATVTDGSGNPVSGQTVVFSFISNLSGATLAPLTGGTTGAGGQALAVYTAGATSSTTAVQDAVQASITGSTGAVIITRTASTVVPPVGYRMALTANVTSLAAGQNSILTATVTDGSGNPVSGLTVTFALLSNNSGATLATLTRGTTGAGGQALAVYTAGATSLNTIVQDTIQASITGSTGAVIITRTAGTGTSTGTASILGLYAFPSTVSGGQMSVITASVYSGSVSSNQNITFNIPVNNSGASFIDSSGASVSTITIPMQLDSYSSIQILATYKAGTNVSGTEVEDIVQVVLGNGAASSILITRAASSSTSAFSITVGAGSLTSKAASSVVTANVKNNLGMAVSGVTVNFAVTGVLPYGTLSVASATTDGSGNAVTIFTGNGAAATNATSVVTASITVSGNTYTSAVIITYP